MNDKIRLGILFGGVSNEHAVSLSSAAAVIEQLDRSAYDLVLIGITRDGRWLRYDGDASDIRNDSWHAHGACVPALLSPDRSKRGVLELTGTEYRFTPIDVIFPILHGKNGEDGTLQGLLELANIPFVGCGALSSAICMDKAVAKVLVAEEGISVPPAVVVTAEQWTSGQAEPLAAELHYPVFVKPARSGSSIGITLANHPGELRDAITIALQHDDKLVIETAIDGVEIGCAVLGGTRLITGTPDEIELAGSFFDYEEKYSLRTSTIHLPARIDDTKAEEARSTALRIYRKLGCRGFARVDLFLSRDGTIYFNEVNTIPGFTSNSRYPNMMRASGIEFPELLDRLIEEALRDWSNDQLTVEEPFL